ncbi:MAG: hypothetical protein JNL62_01660 [Bryobacterales bacterium]|nr:hypothetical protein [Bryobacterales bacterium]
MRGKLLLLNLLLLAGLVLIGRELRSNWRAARAREEAMRAKQVKPPAPPPVTQTAPPQPLVAAGYLDVAQQTLFAKDRNPNVVVEQEKPKPVPPFPKLYGVMNLGDGAFALLSDGRSGQKPFRPGDKVGEFKLAEIQAEALVFEWEQKKFPKKFTELQDKTAEPVSAGDSTPRQAAAPVTPAAPATPAKPGPGPDMGGGLSACNANDPSPAGTVVDGKRKVVTESPFGKVCRWEPVR